jgi:hypothetical protein
MALKTLTVGIAVLVAGVLVLAGALIAATGPSTTTHRSH